MGSSNPVRLSGVFVGYVLYWRYSVSIRGIGGIDDMTVSGQYGSSWNWTLKHLEASRLKGVDET